MDLKRLNNVLNKQGNALDLCFSNTNGVRVTWSEMPMVPEDMYHPALDVVISIFNYPTRSNSDASPPQALYNFSAGDYVGMLPLSLRGGGTFRLAEHRRDVVKATHATRSKSELVDHSWTTAHTFDLDNAAREQR